MCSGSRIEESRRQISKEAVTLPVSAYKILFGDIRFGEKMQAMARYGGSGYGSFWDYQHRTLRDRLSAMVQQC
jgi:hypothetical protein